MSAKESFTPDEWSRVVAAPILVGAAITAADPNGLWGIIKEGMAAGWALVRAKQDQSTDALARAIAEEYATGEARAITRERIQSLKQAAQPADIKRRALEELRAVASIVAEKAPDHASAFSEWIQEIAQLTAGAAKEGGFLGIGGVAVSVAERAALSEISAAFGTRPSSSR
jgi:hypothetical protein